MKWTKEKLDIYFAMKEEGASINEIAEMLGCPRTAIYSKNKDIKKRGGAVMSGHKTVPAPETLESGAYESALAIVGNSVDASAQGISASVRTRRQRFGGFRERFSGFREQQRGL